MKQQPISRGSDILCLRSAKADPSLRPSSNHRTIPRHNFFRLRGISLIELLVGMAIGLISLLVMLETFSASTAHKLNTVSGADATIASHIALTLIQRDLLSAGSGLQVANCSEIRQIDSTETVKTFTFPVTITANTTLGSLNDRSDRIQILSTETAGMGSAILTHRMLDPSSAMFATTAVGFEIDDIILLSEPGKECVTLQLTQTPVWSGGKWLFVRAPSSPHNPPNSNNHYFPPGGYREGVGRILSLGSRGLLIDEYSLTYRNTNGSLPSSDLQVHRSDANGSTTSEITRDVIALRAQYGWMNNATQTVSFRSDIPPGATPNDLVAVRIGIVVRANQRDLSYTSPVEIRLFEDSNPITITLSTDELKYRYRTFETVVPLRNTIWNR